MHMLESKMTSFVRILKVTIIILSAVLTWPPLGKKMRLKKQLRNLKVTIKN